MLEKYQMIYDGLTNIGSLEEDLLSIMAEIMDKSRDQKDHLFIINMPKLIKLAKEYDNMDISNEDIIEALLKLDNIRIIYEEDYVCTEVLRIIHSLSFTYNIAYIRLHDDLARCVYEIYRDLCRLKRMYTGKYAEFFLDAVNEYSIIKP